MSRAMGLDLGTKTIGIALSDPSYLIAQATETIQRKSLDEDLKKLGKLIEEQEVREIVLGLPRHMNHDLGKSAQRSLSFGQTLEKRFLLPVYYQDERLSTVSAERILKESGVRREKRKDYIDAIAASFILQTWLDKKRR